MMSKIDNTKSELCDTCKVKETINHWQWLEVRIRTPSLGG